MSNVNLAVIYYSSTGTNYHARRTIDVAKRIKLGSTSALRETLTV